MKVLVVQKACTKLLLKIYMLLWNTVSLNFCLEIEQVWKYCAYFECEKNTNTLESPFFSTDNFLES